MRPILKTTTLSMADAEAEIRRSLSEQGFGVLTEIDVAATLLTKLGIEREPMKILGACNPTFAHRALQLDADVALLLPCNVVLEAVDGGTKVSVADPRDLMDDPSFADLADEAAAKLTAAVDALGG